MHSFAVTLDLASKIAATTIADIPSAVRARVTDHITDTIGVGLAATGEAAGVIIAGLFTDGAHGATGSARLLGSGKRVEPWDAAWANGSFCHLLDFDDLEHHPSACILPAVLAAGEITGASGADLIVAMTCGYELFSRLSESETSKSHLVRLSRRGIHPMPVLGAPAAAAAAARILGLDGEQTAIAIGIASSSSFGLLEQFGTWTKGIHAGNVARAGFTAAFLASRGYFGTKTAIEGRHGLLNATIGSENYDLTALTAPWGVHWSIYEPGIPLKARPMCGGNQRPASAAIEIHSRSLRTPDEIAHVEVSATEALLESVHVDWPQRGFEGKFSIRYAVAVGLLDGRVEIDSFSDESFARPELQAMLRRIDVKVIPGGYDPGGSEFRRRTKVTVVWKDGTTSEKSVDWPLGSLRNPMSREDIVEKYINSASRVLKAGQVRQSLDLLGSLEEGSVRDLVSSLVAI